MGDESARGIQPIRPADPLLVDPVPRAVPIAPPDAIAVPTRPTVPADIAAQRQGEGQMPRSRREASDATRPRALVTGIVVDLDASRVAFTAADGPPYRGEIDTDLAWYLPAHRWKFPSAESHRMRLRNKHCLLRRRPRREHAP